LHLFFWRDIQGILFFVVFCQCIAVETPDRRTPYQACWLHPCRYSIHQPCQCSCHRPSSHYAGCRPFHGQHGSNPRMTLPVSFMRTYGICLSWSLLNHSSIPKEPHCPVLAASEEFSLSIASPTSQLYFEDVQPIFPHWGTPLWHH
jgi:hypothetical protein